MLKKIYNFAVKQNRTIKNVIKNSATAGIKILSLVKNFRVPNELSLTNYEMLLGVWDKSVYTLLKKVLKKGDVCVDVGAHVGYFTSKAAKIVGKYGKVYAFEANPENFSKLEYNTKKFPQVERIFSAVSDKNGTITFYDSPIGSGRHSIIASRNNEKTARQVKTVNLDDYFKDTKVDLVKIDVEGAELKVLEGMKKMIDRGKISLIVEFCPAFFTGQGLEADILLTTLLSQGFKLWNVEEDKNSLEPITDPKNFTSSMKVKYVNIYAAKE